MTDKLIECDDRQLVAMLRTDGDGSEQGPLIEHVETCLHCQRRLQELAASNDDWRRAGHVLSGTGDAEARTESEFGQSKIPRFPRWVDRHVEWNESMVRQLLQPPNHPEMLGRLGRYEMERLIGSGGMGIVFKAYDSELNRAVAIKLLAPYLASGGSARKRFAREARSAAGVVDDHVVPIHNVESESEPPFLVMQYVAGGSLQEKLDRDGPLEVSEILRIGLQTAKGLAAAHAQGLIHRDVKPSNILLDEGVERALLTDFGLARTEDDACLTRSGFHPGTPHYMSPEQVRGEAIDPRSDLFSLGCVLYALCTGRPPFRAETSYAVLRRITDETPRPIREVNPNVPEWLERIVMRLLQKSPDERFESADELAAVLEDCLAHAQNPTAKRLPESIAALSPKKIFRPPWLKALAGSAVIMLMILAGVLIVLETRKGTIRIKSDVDGVPIVIKKGNEIAGRLTVSQEGASIRVAADDYQIQIDGHFDGVTVKDGHVSVTRGETSIATISKVPRSGSARSGQVNASDSPGADVVQETTRDVRVSKSLEIRETNVANSSGNDVPIRAEDGTELFVDFRRRPIITEDDMESIGFGGGHQSGENETSSLSFTLSEAAGNRLLQKTTQLSQRSGPAYLCITLDGVPISTLRVTGPVGSEITVTGVRQNLVEQIESHLSATNARHNNEVAAGSDESFTGMRMRITKSDATITAELPADGELILQFGRDSSDPVLRRPLKLPAGKFQALVFFTSHEREGKQVPAIGVKVTGEDETYHAFTEPLHSKSLPSDGKFRFRDKIGFAGAKDADVPMMHHRFTVGDIVYPGGAKLPVMLIFSAHETNASAGQQSSTNINDVEAQQDLQRLQGGWEIVEIAESNEGRQEVTIDKAQHQPPLRIVIQENQLTGPYIPLPAFAPIEWMIKLDTSTSPKLMFLTEDSESETPKKRTAYYKWEGDQLKLSFIGPNSRQQDQRADPDLAVTEWVLERILASERP